MEKGRHNDNNDDKYDRCDTSDSMLWSNTYLQMSLPTDTVYYSQLNIIITNTYGEIFLTSFAIVNILYTPPKEYKNYILLSAKYFKNKCNNKFVITQYIKNMSLRTTNKSLFTVFLRCDTTHGNEQHFL